jgi:excinuclease UvrABC ATPase subunit
MSRIKKQLEICPPAYMCKGPNHENFVSTGHKCGYCKGNGWFWGTEEGSREDVHVSCPVCGGSGELDAIITVDWKPSSK